MNAREQNRAAMPNCADAVDRVRAIYGEQAVQVRWLKEGGKEIGKRPPPDAWKTERYDEVMRSLDAHYASTKRGKK